MRFKRRYIFPVPARESQAVKANGENDSRQKMRKFGLIGFPLGHSFSKLFFTEKFNRESLIDCSYENYEFESLILLKNLLLNDQEICGLNVTIPYKSDVIELLDWVDTEAIGIGAVNVIKISYKNNRRIIKGFNTDIYGFRHSLVPHLDGKKIESAIILGKGGSSKAVAFVLKELDINIIYVSRNREDKTLSYGDLTDEIISDNKLIINTTPLGMFPDIHTKPDLNYKCLTSGHILYDLVYNPAMTEFLKKGEEQGCKIFGGLNMLHLQAEKSWEIWNAPDL
jgi:shikimate dehydrogenase